MPTGRFGLVNKWCQQLGTQLPTKRRFLSANTLTSAPSEPTKYRKQPYKHPKYHMVSIGPRETNDGVPLKPFRVRHSPIRKPAIFLPVVTFEPGKVHHRLVHPSQILSEKNKNTTVAKGATRKASPYSGLGYNKRTGLQARGPFVSPATTWTHSKMSASVGLDEIKICEDIGDIRYLRRVAKSFEQRIGLVPTMGALHEGHLDLIRQAAKECDQVFVSIYVNPTQFGVNEDFGSYPKVFREDFLKLQHLNTELKEVSSRGRITTVFRPATKDMYPHGLEYSSHMAIHPSLTQVLEGKARPTFFQGVTTVVMKLLNIVDPDMVYFGQKDIQQLVIIRRMIGEFHLPVALRGCPTRRHEDGLAMSSRNIYLGERRRAVATVLGRLLYGAWSRYADAPEVQRKTILDQAFELAEKLQDEQKRLPLSQRARFELDYLSLADPVSLKELDVVEHSVGAILSGAIVMLPLESPQPGEKLGLGDDQRPVRLIDNLLLGTARKHLGARVGDEVSGFVRPGVPPVLQ